MEADLNVNESAPGRNRTCDLRFRKPLLYPLSYGGDLRRDITEVRDSQRCKLCRLCTMGFESGAYGLARRIILIPMRAHPIKKETQKKTTMPLMTARTKSLEGSLR